MAHFMKSNPRSKGIKLMLVRFFPMVIVVILLTHGCYSVRISNVNGVPEPNPANFEDGYYRGKAVMTIDTTINLKLLENEVMVVETCPEGCFQTIEYRVTLGDALLGGITFGKMRKIRVKYVCLKVSND